jgi:hypothetical protein
MYTTTLKGLGYATSGVNKKVSTVSSEFIKIFTEVDADNIDEKSISFSNLKTAVSGFTEGLTAPASAIPGDRWFRTNEGILYTAITGVSGYIWVEL